MVQLFILGSSSTYGVGASQAGWGDLIKQYIHNRMYAPGGEGEKYEVYNFGKSGATVDFVLENFPRQLEQYGRGGKVICVICVGGNNAKAENEPDNFISTPEEYQIEVSKLLDMLAKNVDGVIGMGNGWIDETKTNPKPNPLTGGKSYMTNSRRQQFNTVNKKAYEERGMSYIETGVKQEVWLSKYLYEDGLHPNQKGHQFIFELIRPRLDELLSA